MSIAQLRDGQLIGRASCDSAKKTSISTKWVLLPYYNVFIVVYSLALS